LGLKIIDHFKQKNPEMELENMIFLCEPTQPEINESSTDFWRKCKLNKKTRRMKEGKNTSKENAK